MTSEQFFGDFAVRFNKFSLYRKEIKRKLIFEEFLKTFLS